MGDRLSQFVSSPFIPQVPMLTLPRIRQLFQRRSLRNTTHFVPALQQHVTRPKCHRTTHLILDVQLGRGWAVELCEREPFSASRKDKQPKHTFTDNREQLAHIWRYRGCKIWPPSLCVPAVNASSSNLIALTTVVPAPPSSIASFLDFVRDSWPIYLPFPQPVTTRLRRVAHHRLCSTYRSESWSREMERP